MKVSIDERDMRRDSCSREVLRHKEFEGCVELKRIRDFFICKWTSIFARDAPHNHLLWQRTPSSQCRNRKRLPTRGPLSRVYQGDEIENLDHTTRCGGHDNISGQRAGRWGR